MPFNIRDIVRHRPHHPGNLWAEGEWRVCNKITSEADWREPTVFYSVKRIDGKSDDRLEIYTCVREEMLELIRKEERPIA